MTAEQTKQHILKLCQDYAISWAAAHHLQSQQEDDLRVERAKEALELAVTEALKGSMQQV